MNCQIDKCPNQGRRNTKYCSAHYERRRLTGSFQEEVPIEKHSFHSMSKTNVYYSWQNAKDRVTNIKSEVYSLYGGRGITMCEEWLDSFDTFYKDMGPRPRGTSLDRIDVNGNYTPKNCRWATPTTQSINQRTHSTNTSGHRGVMWEKRRKRWVAYITIKYRNKYLGSFHDINDAVSTRKEAELKYWGYNVA